MGDYEVSSELYAEFDYRTDKKPTSNQKNVVSGFCYRNIPLTPKTDSDGDIEVVRRTKNGEIYENVIEIEHSSSTELNLVGLQVWRGALLLADWLVANSRTLPEGCILELGSGVGLTSIVASFYRPVICTDIDLGGILNLIEANVNRNKRQIKHDVRVLELDFKKDFSTEIQTALTDVRVVLAADVIYDDSLTDAFVETLKKLVSFSTPKKVVYVALEKRYVFTLADLETGAPCYEYFKDTVRNVGNLTVVELPLDFPQFFKYERAKELVLLKITNGGE